MLILKKNIVKQHKLLYNKIVFGVHHQKLK